MSIHPGGYQLCRHLMRENQTSVLTKKNDPNSSNVSDPITPNYIHFPIQVNNPQYKEVRVVPLLDGSSIRRKKTGNFENYFGMLYCNTNMMKFELTKYKINPASKVATIFNLVTIAPYESEKNEKNKDKLELYFGLDICALVDEVKAQIHIILLVTRNENSTLINVQTFSFSEPGKNLLNKTTLFGQRIEIHSHNTNAFIHPNGSLCLQIFYKTNNGFKWVALKMAKDGSKWNLITEINSLFVNVTPYAQPGSLFRKDYLLMREFFDSPNSNMIPSHKLFRKSNPKAKKYSVDIGAPELSAGVENMFAGACGKYEMMTNSKCAKVVLNKRSLKEPLSRRVKALDFRNLAEYAENPMLRSTVEKMKPLIQNSISRIWLGQNGFATWEFQFRGSRDGQEYDHHYVFELDLRSLVKDTRKCVKCGVEEERIGCKSSLKVCLICKRLNYHKRWWQYPCHYCSDKCGKDDWQNHKKMHGKRLVRGRAPENMEFEWLVRGNEKI